jgi:hypothetical protein
MPHISAAAPQTSLPQTPAETFLEALQDRVYASLGLTAEDWQQRERLGQQLVLPQRLRQKAVELPECEFRRYRDSLLAGLARDEAARRPTRFERPHQYSILRDLQDTVEGAVTRLAFDLPARPVLGTLPTRSLAPLLLRVPGSGEVVVLIDGNLLTYVHLLSKAVAQALPIHVQEEDAAPCGPFAAGWERAIDVEGSGRRRFGELVQATMNGSPAAAPAYLPEISYEQAAADLCDFMELFVVAREYAHVIGRDHLVARPQRRLVHGQTFEALAWTEEQELRADGTGLALLLAAADERRAPLTWACWAADALLASFAVLERAEWLQAAAPGRSLPTPMPEFHDNRRAALRNLLGKWAGGEAAAVFLRNLQPVLDVLEAGSTVASSKDGHAPLH